MSECSFNTYTTDGCFALFLIGSGDGGPDTVLKEAWLTLPGVKMSRRVMMMANGQPTAAVTQAAAFDRLPIHLQDAHVLVRSPELRLLVDRMAATNCLSRLL